ncbi:MAG: molecular chaperone DnaK, partial [Clostridia bacterium]|nr:molecular chaperone DnaK [Clostridia bacterium]
KLSSEDKQTVENEIASFKKIREGNNASEIKSAMESLTQKVYAIFGKLYQQQGGQGAPDMGAQPGPQPGTQNDDGSFNADGSVQ